MKMGERSRQTPIRCDTMTELIRIFFKFFKCISYMQYYEAIHYLRTHPGGEGAVVKPLTYFHCILHAIEGTGGGGGRGSK